MTTGRGSHGVFGIFGIGVGYKREDSDRSSTCTIEQRRGMASMMWIDVCRHTMDGDRKEFLVEKHSMRLCCDSRPFGRPGRPIE